MQLCVERQIDIEEYMNYLVLLAAVLPVIIWLGYIYKKDNLRPEPVGQLVKAFAYGVVSVFVSLAISTPLGELGLYPEETVTILDAIRYAFFAAAVPEEIAKFAMLWLVLRNNKHFDEKMDGIVYAVCISLGFAALENILYLFGNYEEWVSVGISRALFSIPGHMCFGILMGYYYSLLKFSPQPLTKNKIMVLVAPIIAHGVYDAILFIANVTPAVSGVIMLVFLAFCYKMWQYAHKKIAEHLEQDAKED